VEFTTIRVTVGTEAAGLAGKPDKLFRPAEGQVQAGLKEAG